MKSYTDLEQSKKLAEILPLESADMCWTSFDEKWDAYLGAPNPDAIKKEIPCWSLAALLEYLKTLESLVYLPGLFADNKVWILQFVERGHGKVVEIKSNNSVDACYKMIIRLNELKML